MIKMDAKVTVNLKGVDDIRRGLRKGQYVKVGVFGDHKAERTDATINNVELAVIQQFGSLTNNIPARPFIDMPLRYKRAELLKFAASKTIADLLLAGNMKRALALLGVKAENIIQQAFDTRGFGQWRANAPRTIAAKGSDMPLINEGQLRRSVWSKVVS